MTSFINQRVIVIGTSGSGKTTLAAKISSRDNLKHTQLDSIFWKENWISIDRSIFRDRTIEVINEDSWVIDGNHSTVQELILQKATVVIWLNYSLTKTLSRILMRTIKRIYTNEKLYSNNRETFRQSFLSTDSIILWVFRTYWKHKARYGKLFQDKPYANLNYIEINYPNEADSLVQ